MATVTKLALLLLASASATPSPSRPALRKTFTALISGFSYAPGTGNMTYDNLPIAVDQATQESESQQRERVESTHPARTPA